MAVLASKAPSYSSMGMGPNQASMVSQYASSSYRKPVGGSDAHHAPFLSPTESEFSENNDAQESIR